MELNLMPHSLTSDLDETRNSHLMNESFKLKSINKQISWNFVFAVNESFLCYGKRPTNCFHSSGFPHCDFKNFFYNKNNREFYEMMELKIFFILFVYASMNSLIEFYSPFLARFGFAQEWTSRSPWRLSSSNWFLLEKFYCLTVDTPAFYYKQP